MDLWVLVLFSTHETRNGRIARSFFSRRRTRTIPPYRPRPDSQTNLPSTQVDDGGLASRLLFGDGSARRTSSSEAHRAANRGPELRVAADRQRSILGDTPASFPVSADPSADGSAPWYADHAAAVDAVRRNDAIIREEAARAGVDPNLVRAIMYVEMAQGHYFGLGAELDRNRERDVPDFLKSKTVLPMNVSDVWSSLVGGRPDLLEVRQNIRIGAILLKRIAERLPAPAVERVATLYNSLSQETVTDYGARVANVYRTKPW